jgi:hypothetical protein
MKSALSLALLAATTLAVVASPASAARGGHAGPGLPRRRHHARLAAAEPSSSTDIAPPPTVVVVDVVPVVVIEPATHELEARAPRKKPRYPIPAGWSYSGCVLDASQRLLSGLEYSAGDMTVEKCLSSCSDQGFQYGGVECQSHRPVASSGEEGSKVGRARALGLGTLDASPSENASPFFAPNRSG